MFARKGEEVFRDEMDWDVNCPLNTASAYAASSVRELDLDLAWYEAISSYVQGRIDEFIEVGMTGGREECARG